MTDGLSLTRRRLPAGMKIATYANARTALEARKGVAPAFMCGEYLGNYRFSVACSC